MLVSPRPANRAHFPGARGGAHPELNAEFPHSSSHNDRCFFAWILLVSFHVFGHSDSTKISHRAVYHASQKSSPHLDLLLERIVQSPFKILKSSRTLNSTRISIPTGPTRPTSPKSDEPNKADYLLLQALLQLLSEVGPAFQASLHPFSHFLLQQLTS
jgi:hypothetical protein